jgi:hypothetical protein
MGSGPSQATQQQQQLNLQATQSQISFNNTLQQLFSQQFASQQGVLSFLQGAMQPVISQAEQGNGFSPAALAAQRTSATDTNAEQYQSAQQALAEQTQQASGGSKLTGVAGATQENIAALDNASAQQQASSQNAITVNNQNQALSNLFNSANVLNGVAAQENPLGYAASANSGTSAISGLSGAQAGLQNSITNANSSGFLGALGKTFGASLGTTLGTGANNALGGLPGIGSFFG